MNASGPKSLPTIGFLTVLSHPQHGLFGGYLVLSTGGRPIEFHCTAPVKPNRAQEILYGPTLKPYLYGEQIGQTLLSKAKAEPLLVLTDVKPVLAVREMVQVPVALVLSPDMEADRPVQSDETLSTARLDGSHGRPVFPDSNGLARFSLGEHELAVASKYEHDRSLVVARWQPYAEGFDLTEPFGRIREAIQEAQRSAA